MKELKDIKINVINKKDIKLRQFLSQSDDYIFLKGEKNKINFKYRLNTINLVQHKNLIKQKKLKVNKTSRT